MRKIDFLTLTKIELLISKLPEPFFINDFISADPDFSYDMLRKWQFCIMILDDGISPRLKQRISWTPLKRNDLKNTLTSG